MSTEAFARRAIAQNLPLQIDGKFNRPDDAAMTSETSGATSLLHFESPAWGVWMGCKLSQTRLSAYFDSRKWVPTCWHHTDPRAIHFHPCQSAEMLESVAKLLAPFAAGGAESLRAPLHASAQRWGSALYPVPAGEHGHAEPPAAGY